MKEKKENNVYRDTTFRYIFREEENFKKLYEDLTGKQLNSELELFDTTNLITKQSFINDVSFKTKDDKLIVMIEHQSSLNENMALRCCIYYFDMVQKFIKNKKLNMYRKGAIKIPQPEFYIVYNGKENLKSEEYNLENNFFEETDFIKVKTLVHNIRYKDLDQKLKETKDILVGYSFFVERVEFYREKGMSVEDSVNKVFDECKKEGLLIDYVDRKEFMSMAIDVFTQEDMLRDSEEYGKEKAKKEVAISMIEKGFEISQISDITGLNIEELKKLQNELEPITEKVPFLQQDEYDLER